ncbi:unnamed protein product [Paramecium pentaurelia]|uniref:Uncharacterized protein n=1 Tax=Paramecium pentaurelia TaxID=43138 RepID=A0A8S1TWI5_9CILI|nr:unnamed protein product [Paramecium pentaurelia]
MISIKLIEELQKNLYQLKFNFVQQLDQLIGNVDESIKYVLTIGQQNVTYSYYEELEKLIIDKKLDQFNLQPLIDQINQINISCNQKSEKKLNSFQSFQYSQKCEEILKKLKNIQGTKENIQEQILNKKQKDVIQVENEQKQLEQ